MTLRLEGVSFSRGNRIVLRDITTEFPDRGLTCLVGTNATGKTTLLRILSGELRPASGRFFIRDIQASTLSQRELAGYFSVIPQHLQSPSDLTVSQMVELARFRPRGSFLWRLSEADRRIVAESLRRCQMEKLADRKMGELSGGEQQRAWLAFCLAQEKEFLLLDETLDGLDYLAKRSFFRLLNQVASEGKGVLLTTHDLGLVTEFAPRIVVLRGGRIAYEGAPHADLQHLLVPPDNA